MIKNICIAVNEKITFLWHIQWSHIIHGYKNNLDEKEESIIGLLQFVTHFDARAHMQYALLHTSYNTDFEALNELNIYFYHLLFYKICKTITCVTHTDATYAKSIK